MRRCACVESNTISICDYKTCELDYGNGLHTDYKQYKYLFNNFNVIATVLGIETCTSKETMDWMYLIQSVIRKKKHGMLFLISNQVGKEFKYEYFNSFVAEQRN